MYGVAFVVEEVDLLLKPREFLRRAGADGAEEGRESLPPPLSRDDLEVWFTARQGSIMGQVMSSCKVRAPKRGLAFLSPPTDELLFLTPPNHKHDRAPAGQPFSPRPSALWRRSSSATSNATGYV